MHLATVDGFGGHSLQAKIAQFGGPLLPGRFEGGQRFAALLQTGVDQLGGIAGFVAGTLAAEQRAHARHKRSGAAPMSAHPVEGIVVHRVAEQPPVIAQYFAEQVAVIGFQCLGNRLPLSNACSRSMRWHQLWMVDTAASSIHWAAMSRRLAQVGHCSGA